ncbi:hypothetical protein [Microbacterium lacus]|uniref:hypothetical protein n=1 Tax=Microbacterium lacus TaxID=415217 RepID=UPI000C2CA239|nr:hypothetical protein [Microbacterium lacus]
MSTVAPIEGTDIDLSWVDLEEEVPCEVPGCSNEAAWNYRCKACGKRNLVCEAHHRRIGAQSAFGMVFKCSSCNGSWKPLSETFDIIPI